MTKEVKIGIYKTCVKPAKVYAMDTRADIDQSCIMYMWNGNNEMHMRIHTDR